MNSKLEMLIPDLLSEDLEVQGEAIDRFYELNDEGEFDSNDAVALLRLAIEMPTPEEDADDGGRDLLVYAREIASECETGGQSVVTALREAFDSLSPGRKVAALQILVVIPTAHSVEVYLDAVERHAAEFADEMLPMFGPDAFDGDVAEGGEEGGVADALFPGILRLTECEEHRRSVYQMLLGFLEEERLDTHVLAEHEPRFAAMLEEEVAALRSQQRENVAGRLNSKYESPYCEHRDLAGIMMDIAGWWGAESVIGVVEAMDDLADPHIRLIRAVSLVRAGRRVPHSEFEEIARSPRERYWMHQMLTKMGKGDDLPAVCHDQGKLAEGEMVEWLTFPTELNREPDEIELVHVETREAEDEPGKLIDHYFFRFRVTERHWAKKEGWMVGMAGGYVRRKEGTSQSDGGTFSHFHRWKAKTLEQHVAEYME